MFQSVLTSCKCGCQLQMVEDPCPNEDKLNIVSDFNATACIDMKGYDSSISSPLATKDGTLLILQEFAKRSRSKIVG